MKDHYDPERHHRRSIRLPGYDYTGPGAYFVTLCVADQSHLFGEVVDGEMALNDYGQVVHYEWLKSAEIRREIELNTFVVMPNHFHAIVWIVGAYHYWAHAGAPNNDTPGGASETRADGRPPLHRPPKSLGSLIAGYKSAVTKQINLLRDTPGVAVWQRNYWEHIIRTERALGAIRAYIENNPARWEWDTYHPAPTGRDAQAAEIWQMLQKDENDE